MCTFCNREEFENNILFETEDNMIIADLYPLAIGHIMVIPKKHHQYMHEVEFSVLEEQMKMIQKASIILRQKFKGIDLNILLCDGPKALQTIPHMHWHVVPRWGNDVGLDKLDSGTLKKITTIQLDDLKKTV
ncbi:MAG: HIT family protein, partial [Enterococcus sp.]